MARLRGQTSTVTTNLGNIVAGTSAPASPHIGLRWYNSATGVTYQYTSDGATSFWLDISSGGIGTSSSRSVDFVGDTDPHLETATVGGGLVIGSVYYNREGNRYFTCTTATDNANVWAGRYAGAGGIETTYKSGTDFYRAHTFLSDGTFHMDSATTVDWLVVAGGGGGGYGEDGHKGGGGGAGGFRHGASHSVTVKSYPITVGAGGIGGTTVTPAPSGGNSVFDTVTSTGGGGGGAGEDNSASNKNGRVGGSGGGSGSSGQAAVSGGAATSITPISGETTTVQGYAGGAGAQHTGASGGGGGAAGVGSQSSNNATVGNGGAGVANAWRTGSNITYSVGGYTLNSAPAEDNTGNGGGGAKNMRGGTGGSGIVVIRYQLNA